MTEPALSTRDILRGDILAMGGDDFVSMADVQACIFDGKLNALSAEHQPCYRHDEVATEDGLVEVGVIQGRITPGSSHGPERP